ncbi:MAG TPA: hypothetical protein DC049_18960, partial [Spirochaetia bacterium]|nr:hypothetical protein [Spirochaetia bacterium]
REMGVDPVKFKNENNLVFLQMKKHAMNTVIQSSPASSLPVFQWANTKTINQSLFEKGERGGTSLFGKYMEGSWYECTNITKDWLKIRYPHTVTHHLSVIGYIYDYLREVNWNDVNYLGTGAGTL